MQKQRCRNLCVCNFRRPLHPEIFVLALHTDSVRSKHETAFRSVMRSVAGSACSNRSILIPCDHLYVYDTQRLSKSQYSKYEYDKMKKMEGCKWITETDCGNYAKTVI